MFVEEDDKAVNPLGVKGMGEPRMVGIGGPSRTPSFTLPQTHPGTADHPDKLL